MLRGLLVLSLFAFLSALGQEDVLVTLPTLGVIRGQTRLTKGNMGQTRKSFYNFRNIPFAEPVSGQRRFTQPTPLRTEIGTIASPYDATRDGPFCPQLGLNEDSLANLTSHVIDDIIFNVLTNLELIDQISVETVLIIMEDLLQTPMAGLTVETFLLNLLDLTLSVKEDCLHLAVSTPRLPAARAGGDKQSELLPVMFFIYGGAFIVGTQVKMGYERLGDVNDVVLVTANYRVGFLGFACMDTDEAAGNMGLLDQIVALEWVQENIAAFGGDPTRVTVFGQSAGAACVSMLTLSPLTQGLFVRAIGESGSAVAAWAYEDEQSEFHARKIAEKVGCTQQDVDQVVECLRQLDYNSLTQADQEYSVDQLQSGKELGFGAHDPCGQTKGARKVIQHGQHPMDLLQSGNYNAVPMFFGANYDEGVLPYGVAEKILNETQTQNAEWLTDESVHFVLHLCGVNVTYEESYAIRDEYFTPDQLGDWEAMAPGFIDLSGALLLKDPSYAVVENNYRLADSFFYSLQSRMKKSIQNLLTRGDVIHKLLDTFAAHGDDMLYLFDFNVPVVLCDRRKFFTGLTNAYLRCVIQVGPELAEKCVTAPDSAFRDDFGECVDGHLLPDEEPVSDAMVKAFTNFAIYGTPTPTGSDLPNLSPWTPALPNYIVFDKVTTVASDFRLSYHSTPQKKQN